MKISSTALTFALLYKQKHSGFCLHSLCHSNRRGQEWTGRKKSVWRWVAYELLGKVICSATDCFTCCGRRMDFTGLASYLCRVASLKFVFKTSYIYKQSWCWILAKFGYREQSKDVPLDKNVDGGSERRQTWAVRGKLQGSQRSCSRSWRATDGKGYTRHVQQAAVNPAIATASDWIQMLVPMFPNWR